MSAAKRVIKLKSTGEKVEVYKLQTGNWCNWNDMQTEYKPEEVEIIN